MAKDISIVIPAPPGEDLLERWVRFLVERTAKQAGLEVTGAVRERAAGETGSPVRPAPRSKKEAS